MKKLGTIKTPLETLNIINFIEFEEIDKRKITILLSENNTIVLNIQNNSNDITNEQQIHLTKESFSLLFLSMIKAQKHFNINTEKILNKMSPTNNFLYNYFKENYKD